MLTPQGAGVTEGALRTWIETVLTGTVCSDSNVCLSRARWRDRDSNWGWQLRLATVEAVITAGFHLQVASRGVTVGEQVVEIKVRRAGGTGACCVGGLWQSVVPHSVMHVDLFRVFL